MDISDKLRANLIKKAFVLVDSGFFDADDWESEFISFLNASNNDLLGWSPNEIKEIVDMCWNSEYQHEGLSMTISAWAMKIRQETKCQTSVRNSMDRLFNAIESYKNSDFFLEMLQFCANFKELAPYNSMMVKTQMPSARYVLNEKMWGERYGRKPKRDARPLVILRKYGPVDYVYEIGDTETTGRYSLFSQTDEEILESLANPYKTEGTVRKDLYDTLVHNLAYYGIGLESFRVASSYGGRLLKTRCKVDVNGLETDGNYVISVSDKSDMSASFATICHELGHYFCYHLNPPAHTNPDDWWTRRHLSWEEQEFEAEIVSYIICERNGVGNKSWEYLSRVIGKEGKIPANISVDRIFKATNEVERMLSTDLSPRTCLLYFFDKEYKKRFDKKFPRKEGQKESEE